MTDDHLFKPGHKKTGGRVKGVRNKVSNQYLQALYEVGGKGHENLVEALKILKAEDPAEFAKLYQEVFKRDPQLAGDPAIPVGGLIFTWADPTPRHIYVRPDGTEFEKTLDGKEIELTAETKAALLAPPTTPITRYEKD